MFEGMMCFNIRKIHFFFVKKVSIPWIKAKHEKKLFPKLRFHSIPFENWKDKKASGGFENNYVS